MPLIDYFARHSKLFAISLKWFLSKVYWVINTHAITYSCSLQVSKTTALTYFLEIDGQQYWKYSTALSSIKSNSHKYWPLVLKGTLLLWTLNAKYTWRLSIIHKYFVFLYVKNKIKLGSGFRGSSLIISPEIWNSWKFYTQNIVPTNISGAMVYFVVVYT